MLPDAGSPESGRRESDLRRAPSAHAGCDSVLFHPDCNRRLRNRTESADPAAAGARGLMRKPVRNHRRWGISPRPENVREGNSRGRIIAGEQEIGTAPGGDSTFADEGSGRGAWRPARAPRRHSISRCVRGAISFNHMKIVSMSRPSMCLPTVSKLVWRPWTCCETAYASRNRRSKAWSSKIAVEPARR